MVGLMEIKFRIWDCDNENLQYSGISFNNLEELRQNLDSFEDYFGSGYIKDNPEYLMQFSGILDINGKEIYTGDIIKIPDDYDSYGMVAGEIREVYFAFGGFRLKPKDVSQRGNWIEDGNDFEVIGNIYEVKK